jgi:hypothetical protein
MDNKKPAVPYGWAFVFVGTMIRLIKGLTGLCG